MAPPVSDSDKRFVTTAAALYSSPRAREDDYLGGLRRGQALRWTGKREGNFVHVVALNPDGSEQKSRGWVDARLLKQATQNMQVLGLFQQWLDAGQPEECSFAPGFGPSSCGKSWRTMLGLPKLARHAKDFGRPLLQQGYRQRRGVYYPGDTLVYGGHAGSTYRGGGSGHIGTYVEVDGKPYLWSYLNGGWKLSRVGQPIGVYYRP